MSNLALRGALTALVTPFSSDSTSIDIQALEALVLAQVDGGIDGIVPCGTTGESPTLSDAEKRDIISRTVKLVNGRVPVVAGTGSNNTANSIRASQAAIEAGADAVMIVMPYYNKPSQEGLFRHVTAIAGQIGGAPIVLYNIPGRSVVDLSTDTLARIVDVAPNVIAIKDATGNVLRCQQVVARFGDAFSVLCGDDALTPAMMVSGARGVISVTSNVYPDAVSAICRAMEQGNLAKARRLHFALLPVHEAMFVEPSPAPVKSALASRNQLELVLRLPLVAPTEATSAYVGRAMAAFEASRAE